MVRLLPIVFTICVFFQLFQVAMGWGLDSTGKQIKHWRIENKTSINSRPSVRSVLNLYSMIECATNCDPWNLKYYGNYCGFGGSGKPINDIDSCCEQHDACYDDNTRFYDCSSSMYVFSYDWSYEDGQPSCRDGFDKCGYWTCVCDKAFMECLNDAGCP